MLASVAPDDDQQDTCLPANNEDDYQPHDERQNRQRPLPRRRAVAIEESINLELNARLEALAEQKQNQHQEHLKKMKLLEMQIKQCEEKHVIEMEIAKLVKEKEMLQIRLLQNQLNL